VSGITEWANETNSPGGDFSGTLSTVVAALSILGVLVFALLASAYTEYYRAFDLSLEDVGLGYTRVL
jgi:hypothetical protein